MSLQTTIRRKGKTLLFRVKRGILALHTRLKNRNVYSWRTFSLILLFLLFVLFSTGQRMAKAYRARQQVDRSIIDRLTKEVNERQPIPSKTTPIPTPSIPTKEAAPIEGRSLGVFYPMEHGMVINTPMPTIIGKVEQKKEFFLPTSFGEEDTIGFGKQYLLRFHPGRVKNLTVTVDKYSSSPMVLTEVFAIPLYPTVTCRSSIREKKGYRDEVYTTEKECIEKKKDDIPPILFFTKPRWILSEGFHRINVNGTGDEIYPETTFAVMPEYHMPAQPMYMIDRFETYQYPLMNNDTCGEGYYYDLNYLQFPVPTFNNTRILYGMSYPQRTSEIGGMSNRRVQIAFEGKQFDLFVPQASILYGEEKKRHSFHVPKDHLVFPDGTRATYKQVMEFNGAYNLHSSAERYARGYYEIYPMDTTGGLFPDLYIPWVIERTTACDG